MVSKNNLRFFDIAANLCDDQFKGIYYDKKHHESDIDDVIERAHSVGCDRFLFVGGKIEDSEHSYELAKKDPNYYCTVGVHPCMVMDVENYESQEKYIEKLEKLIVDYGDKCVAVGECGLDYDRFDYAPKEP